MTWRIGPERTEHWAQRQDERWLGTVDASSSEAARESTTTQSKTCPEVPSRKSDNVYSRRKKITTHQIRSTPAQSRAAGSCLRSWPSSACDLAQTRLCPLTCWPPPRGRSCQLLCSPRCGSFLLSRPVSKLLLVVSSIRARQFRVWYQH